MDCHVEKQYYNEDLQQFPIEANEEIPPLEEIFATEADLEPEDHQVLSPPPPNNASGYIRLTKTEEIQDLALTTVACCNQINNSSGKFYLKTLFNSGSTYNILTRSALPKNTQVIKLTNPVTMATAKGYYSCTDYAYLSNIMFPELSYSRECKKIKVYIVDAKMIYHLIIGRQYMKKIALKMDFESSTIEWYDKFMKFHPRSYFNNSSLIRKVMTNEPFAIAESYIAQAKQQAYVYSSTKYVDTDLQDLAGQQVHLSSTQQKRLLDILNKHSSLFEGLNDR